MTARFDMKGGYIFFSSCLPAVAYAVAKALAHKSAEAGCILSSDPLDPMDPEDISCQKILRRLDNVR